jgi:hypothetical protein
MALAIAMSAENLLHAPAARTRATKERKPSLKKTSARTLSPIAYSDAKMRRISEH